MTAALENRQLCTFRLDDYVFGVDVTSVQEVLRYQEMTPVPLSPPIVAGLINLRGQIVTGIDLRRRLGLPDRAGDALPMNVVLHREGGPVSLLVDEIGDVVDVDGVDYEPSPETLDDDVRALVVRVYKLDDELLLELDTELAVQSPSETLDRRSVS